MSVNEHVMMSSNQRSSLCHPANFNLLRSQFFILPDLTRVCT